jgi:hypothetical protein
MLDLDMKRYQIIAIASYGVLCGATEKPGIQTHYWKEGDKVLYLM